MPSVPSNGPTGGGIGNLKMPEKVALTLHIESPEIKVDVDFGEQKAEDHVLGLQGLIAWFKGEADFIYAKGVDIATDL